MRVSLDLWDGLDVAGMIGDIEAAFDTHLTPAELRQSFTMGDLQDRLVARLPAEAERGKGCPTAIAFWRLRAALRPHVPGLTLRPSTPIGALRHLSHVRLRRVIEADTGFALPPPEITMGFLLGWLALLIAVPGGTYQAGLSGGLAFALALAILALPRLWPHRLPGRIVTLGDLARDVADRNPVRLARLGARLDEQAIWNRLCVIASDYGDVPAADIARHTRLTGS
ncbi:hypothetical protein [Zavarzinia aquatilis]|uniref:Uncharacterized protein n=1 Tax=Zavarzinia aquatilis TaxID=2211142 RepID=A0A317EBS8_9PROT|nr:hypothetical protein [Zavarzinia aquatilis]PWR24518.1 hypothetical protein DKG74_06855 [Zavarzinia aquatilis]